MIKMQKRLILKNKLFIIVAIGIVCFSMTAMSVMHRTMKSKFTDRVEKNYLPPEFISDDGINESDTLAQLFTKPPPGDRPEVFWQWMGGMISKEGIKKDLIAMAEEGIGGVLVMQVTDQTPNPKQWAFRNYPDKVECLSDEWFDMVNYAIGVADSLGLNFSIFMNPGWSHIGGPWVTPQKGLKQLVGSSVKVEGAIPFDQILKQPPRVVPKHSGEEIPSWLKSSDSSREVNNSPAFYQDIAVVAVPAPGPDKVTSSQSIQDITAHMDAKGRLKWVVPAGSWTIVRLGVASENGVNHPAPKEATGQEADRMDTSAIKLVFNGMIARILREARAKGYHSFKAFETDSYEAGFQDFGMDFRKQFKQRRGYDCLPWLPAWLNKKLVIGSGELTQRFRYDMMRTISELIVKRTHSELRSLADRNNVKWMTEPYFKLKIDWRTAAARSTMPGSEVWVGKPVDRLIGAAPDIAALYGLPVVWAEIFSAESYNSAWRNTPWVLKPYGDAAFCHGINHFFMHGFVLNPFDDRYQPGLTMSYWGTQLGRHVTWWSYAAPWHLYLARCQFMLRQGQPVNDILAYPPKEEHIPNPVINAGPFRQVVLNDEALLTRLSVHDGRIIAKDGGDFAALAITPDMALRPEALRKIRALVKAGATLIGDTPPLKSPSLENYPACDSEVAGLVKELWGNEKRSEWGEHSFGKGRVFSTRRFSEVLNKLTGGPDVHFSTSPDSASKYLNFEHRRDSNTEIYFVCNTGDQLVDVNADFRVSGLIPEEWDAVTGEKRTFPTWQEKGGRTTLRMRFEPRQSFFIVFRKEADKTASGPLVLSAPKSIAKIDGPWDVSFDTRWGGPKEIKFNQLEDWANRKEKGIKYYSGTAVYRKTFDLTSLSSKIEKASPLYLNLGEVNDLARVTLNGKDLGIIWSAPWQLKIPHGLLKKKNNQLVISVVNTWANRLIGDAHEPEDCDFVKWDVPTNRKGGYDINIPGYALKDLPDWFIKGQPRPSRKRFTFTIWQFYNREAPLLTSGLLGPVTIQMGQ